MKIAVVSFAHMHAYSYAKSLLTNPNVELVAVADSNEERGRAAAEQCHTRYFRDYQDLLKTDVEAVVVCTENVHHADVAVAAAEAGKHVLCEKPIATTISDAKRMIAACEAHHVSLGIAFPVRFSAPIQKVKSMLDRNALGRVLAMRGTNRGQNPGGWFIEHELSGGGAVLDHTVHVVDIMRWLLKSEVKEVYAEVDTKFNDIDIDDCGILTLEFKNGVFASHDPSWSRCKMFPTWGDVTLEVIGTDGVTTVDAFAQHSTIYSDAEHRVNHAFWGNDMDEGLINDFVTAVGSGTSPMSTGEDGLRALEVALAAYESGRTHLPVRIDSLS